MGGRKCFSAQLELPPICHQFTNICYHADHCHQNDHPNIYEGRCTGVRHTFLTQRVKRGRFPSHQKMNYYPIDQWSYSLSSENEIVKLIIFMIIVKFIISRIKKIPKTLKTNSQNIWIKYLDKLSYTYGHWRPPILDICHIFSKDETFPSMGYFSIMIKIIRCLTLLMQWTILIRAVLYWLFYHMTKFSIKYMEW